MLLITASIFCNAGICAFAAYHQIFVCHVTVPTVVTVVIVPEEITASVTVTLTLFAGHLASDIQARRDIYSWMLSREFFRTHSGENAIT